MVSHKLSARSTELWRHTLGVVHWNQSRILGIEKNITKMVPSIVPITQFEMLMLDFTVLTLVSAGSGSTQLPLGAHWELSSHKSKIRIEWLSLDIISNFFSGIISLMNLFHNYEIFTYKDNSYLHEFVICNIELK